MKRIHIVGRRNHGKTTLTVELVRALTAKGYKVGTLKHSSHHHILDTPGKDSYRHREAGGNPACIVTPDITGVFFRTPTKTDIYEKLAPLYEDCDLVVVEGNIDSVGPKLEVWRQERGTPSLALERDDIVGLISDDTPPEGVTAPRIPRQDLDAIAEKVIDVLGLTVQSEERSSDSR